MVGGDFNTILDIYEKVGGIQHLSQSSLDFKIWCNKHSMIDIPINNENFTWNNRRKDFTYITEKLDSFFIIGDLNVNNLNFQSSILPIARSNHFPVRLEFIEPTKPARNPFKCEKCGSLILISLRISKNGG